MDMYRRRSRFVSLTRLERQKRRARIRPGHNGAAFASTTKGSAWQAGSVSGLAQGRRSRWLASGLAGGVGGRPQRARLDTRAGGDEHHRRLHGRVAFVRRLHGGQARGWRVGGRGHADLPPDALPRFLRQDRAAGIHRADEPDHAGSARRAARPQIRHRRRDAGFGLLALQQRTDQDRFAWEPFITVPVGRYDGSRPDVSPGKNRWSTVQDFSFVQGVGESTFLEAIAEVEIYGRNTDWFGQTLKKDPSLRLFALASTNLTENTYTGVRYRYETGGRERSGGQTVTSRAQPPAGAGADAPDQSVEPDSAAIHPRPQGRERPHARRADALCLRILGTGS